MYIENIDKTRMIPKLVLKSYLWQ